MKPYEAEVRFFVDENFKEKLEKMGFVVKFEYSFEDLFFCPPDGWKGEGKTLRARNWGDECEVLFTSVEKVKVGDVEFKRSKYPEGKVKLYEGSLKDCVQLLEDMEFVPCGVVKKEVGYIMSDGRAEVALELINGRWVLEVEVKGEDPEAAASEIREVARRLGLKNPISLSTFELFVKGTRTTSPS